MYNAWLSNSSRASSEMTAESNSKKTLLSLIWLGPAHAVTPNAIAANKNLFIFFPFILYILNLADFIKSCQYMIFMLGVGVGFMIY